jgi:hypothetical protein
LITRKIADWIVVAGEQEIAEITSVSAIFADGGVEFYGLRPS